MPTPITDWRASVPFLTAGASNHWVWKCGSADVPLRASLRFGGVEEPTGFPQQLPTSDDLLPHGFGIALGFRDKRFALRDFRIFRRLLVHALSRGDERLPLEANRSAQRWFDAPSVGLQRQSLMPVQVRAPVGPSHYRTDRHSPMFYPRSISPQSDEERQNGEARGLRAGRGSCLPGGGPTLAAAVRPGPHPLHNATSKVIDAIADVAEVVTGDRRAFYASALALAAVIAFWC